MSDYKADRWVNGKGVLAGREAFIRKNVSLCATRTTDYPTSLLVSLIYRETADSGLPSSGEELDRLDATEETIADRICSRHFALFALCITTDGTRDLFLFLPRRPTEQEIEEELAACSPAVDYDFAIGHDPQWHPFRKLLPQPGEGS